MTLTIERTTVELDHRIGDPRSGETLSLDESQELAVKEACEWFDARRYDPKVRQVFRIGGMAGTGKTTIIREIIGRYPDLNIIVCTLAGKAASVLQSKGIRNAINLHQVFYQPDPKMIERKHELDVLIEQTGDPAFRAVLRKELADVTRKMFLPRETIESDLIIVDEASMVSGRVAEDLKRYGVPILAVGDPNQLPPVEESSTPALFSHQVPDVELSTNHRSVGDLTEVSEAARLNRPLPESVIIDSVDYSDYDVVLVFKNQTRWDLIRQIRTAKSKPVNQPVPGDEIIVWKNNPDEGVFNGSTFTVETVDEGEHPDAWWIKFTNGEYRNVAKKGFWNQSELDLAVKKKNQKNVVATFAEVLTVHKAQGSEWDRVLVAEHPHKGYGRDNTIRWRYTAVTRARETVHVIGTAFLKAV